MGRVDKPQLTEGRQNRGGAEPTAPTERRMAQQTVPPDHGILAALVSTQNTQRCVPLRFHAGRDALAGPAVVSSTTSADKPIRPFATSR